jgi:hypothetical protein
MGDQESGADAKENTNRRPLLRASVVGLALIVALIAWLATRGDDKSSPEAIVEGAPRIVSEAELKEVAAALGQPIYWAGPIAETALELEELGEGSGARVRYVPEGSEAGEAPATVLTIGSYPLADAAAAVRGYGERAGGVVKRGLHGQEVVTDAKRPTSVYFAGPDNSVQVEVYDPSATKAMRLALSGKVVLAE